MSEASDPGTACTPGICARFLARRPRAISRVERRYRGTWFPKVRTQARSERGIDQGIERLLAQEHGRRHAVLTGSGTAALAIACQQAAPDRNRIVIPAIACAQVLFAVRYAGREPVLADVREADGTLDADSVASLLKSDPSIGA